MHGSQGKQLPQAATCKMRRLNKSTPESERVSLPGASSLFSILPPFRRSVTLSFSFTFSLFPQKQSFLDTRTY